VLFEYTAQQAFTCGTVSEAIGIAIRNFAPNGPRRDAASPG
jgi:hypothetical protein